MNAAEHLRHIADRTATAPLGSLRRSLYEREGVEATDDAIRHGLRVWAIERVTANDSGEQRQTAVVFGRNRSDALRRASAPARLGEETALCTTIGEEITSGRDEPFVWPIARRDAATKVTTKAAGPASLATVASDNERAVRCWARDLNARA